ncbi:MAG: hypothetical protein U0790_00150 [Isosphaeraceae bacterium]
MAADGAGQVGREPIDRGDRQGQLVVAVGRGVGRGLAVGEVGGVDGRDAGAPAAAASDDR